MAFQELLPLFPGMSLAVAPGRQATDVVMLRTAAGFPDPTAASQVVADIQAAAVIRSSEVAPVLVHHVDAATSWVAYPWVDGVPLGAALHAAREAGRPAAMGVLARIMLDAVSGLSGMHRNLDPQGNVKPVTHGALRVDSLWLGFDGHTVISDAGFASVRGRLEAPQSPRDLASDVHALGCVLYWMLTGVMPPATQTAGHDPRAVDPTVPAPLATVIQRTTHPSPALRPSNAMVVMVSLESALRNAGGVGVHGEVHDWLRTLFNGSHPLVVALRQALQPVGAGRGLPAESDAGPGFKPEQTLPGAMAAPPLPPQPRVASLPANAPAPTVSGSGMPVPGAPRVMIGMADLDRLGLPSDAQAFAGDPATPGAPKVVSGGPVPSLAPLSAPAPVHSGRGTPIAPAPAATPSMAPTLVPQPAPQPQPEVTWPRGPNPLAGAPFGNGGQTTPGASSTSQAPAPVTGVGAMFAPRAPAPSSPLPPADVGAPPAEDNWGPPSSLAALAEQESAAPKAPSPAWGEDLDGPVPVAAGAALSDVPAQSGALPSIEISLTGLQPASDPAPPAALPPPRSAEGFSDKAFLTKENRFFESEANAEPVRDPAPPALDPAASAEALLGAPLDSDARPPPKKRSSLPWILGGVLGALAIGSAAFVLTPGAEPAEPPPLSLKQPDPEAPKTPEPTDVPPVEKAPDPKEAPPAEKAVEPVAPVEKAPEPKEAPAEKPVEPVAPPKKLTAAEKKKQAAEEKKRKAAEKKAAAAEKKKAALEAKKAAAAAKKAAAAEKKAAAAEKKKAAAAARKTAAMEKKAPAPAKEESNEKPAAEPAKAAEPAQAAAVGTLVIKVAPWANVWVDGKKLGTTPLQPLSLKPGKHAVRLENKELKVNRKETVTITSGQTSELKINLAK